LNNKNLTVNNGRELEGRLLLDLRQEYGANVYSEQELTKLYGWNASSVDFLIETEDHLIFMQVKYLATRRRESIQINKFISSIKHIRMSLPEHSLKKTMIGVWVCKLYPFGDNVKLLENYNIKVVSSFESIDTLIEDALTWVRVIAK
jgi:hypothetical protein